MRCSDAAVNLLQLAREGLQPFLRCSAQPSGCLRYAVTGREKFLEEVYKWVEQYGGRICSQLRRIGSSVDWSRCVFTMDQNMSVGVVESVAEPLHLHHGTMTVEQSAWSQGAELFLQILGP